jgi:gliding motility-associated-like protein
MNKKFIYTLFCLFLIFSLPDFLFAHLPLKIGQEKTIIDLPARPSVKTLLPSTALSASVNTILTSGFYKNNYAANSTGTAQPVTICSGASIVIKGDSQTIPPDSYSWEVLQGATWQLAPGINNMADYPPSLLVNNTGANVVFSIRRQITTAGVSGYDSYYDVTVLPSAPISNNVATAPSVNTYCSPGNPTTIGGSTPSGGNGTFTYQWQSSVDNVNFTDISGATSNDYTPPQLTTTTYYRRTVTGSSCVVPSQSNAVGIIILPPIANNTVTSPAINSFCSSGDPTIITGSTPTGGSGTFAYQWQSSTDDVNFTDIAGANTASYDPPLITTTTYYRRSITSGVCSVPFLSNVITITILPAVTNNVITAPAVIAFCVIGDPAALSGNVPVGGNGVYSYQWQSSIDGTNFTNIAGATAVSYDPSAVNATTYYRRIITVSGSCTTPLPSNVLTITIMAAPVAPVPSQSVVTVCPGSAATLSVNPQSGFTYNWYDSPARTTLLFTGTTYITPPQTTNKTFYVEGFNGSCTSATTATVQVTMAVPPAAPSVVSSTVNTCAGSSATFNVSSPQAGFTYNWYQASTTGSPISTGNSYTSPVLSTSAVYYVEATNAAGCISTTRTPANVTVTPLPLVTVQGASVCPGSNATLSATADAPNATINWYANATGGSPIFTGSTFTTPALSSAASYYVEATNNASGCVSATRQLVQAQLLQQLPAPVVTAGATDVSSVTFNWVAVSGAAAYQVSVDNGQTYNSPSSGSSGLSHTITGLYQNQAVSILVRAMGGSSCQLSDNSIAVTAHAINQTDDIFVANAFTPNGDGKNDIVYVHSQSIKTLSFYVYNQWGGLILLSTDLAKGWDGTYKGVMEPAGVYIYYVKAVMNNGHEVNKKGTITLIR